MEKVLFSEEQRYTQWWLYLIMLASLLSVLILFSVGIYQQVVLDKPFGDQPMSTEGLTVTGVFSVIIIALIFLVVFKSKLKTKVTNKALWLSFPPLMRKWKQIVPEQIERYEIRTYHAKREYRGYGLRRGRRRYGAAYTISGNIGVQLHFKNGKKLLIGTQKKQTFEYAMRKLMEGEE